MIIKFKNEKIKNQLEDCSFLNKKYGKAIAKKFQDFISVIESSDNLYNVKEMMRSLNIEKLKNHENLWSARLNKKYRIEFTVVGDQTKIIGIKEISINRIHPHKYNK